MIHEREINEIFLSPVANKEYTKTSVTVDLQEQYKKAKLDSVLAEMSQQDGRRIHKNLQKGFSKLLKTLTIDLI